MTTSPTRTWTTCATCEGLVLVSEDWNQVNHPTCKRDTQSDLAERYRAAVEADDTGEADRLEAQLDNIDRTDRERSLRNTAYWYARRGWPVFPLRPGSKRPLTEHGLRDATTDRDLITRWWTEVPAANIGITTGVMFDVLDVDWLDKSGRPTRAAAIWPVLQESGKFPDIHGVALTARSGLHLFLRPRGWHNAAGRFRDPELGTIAVTGIDIRGMGGYIVAPPSRLPDGAMWKWAVRPSPRICGLPDWPGGTEQVLQPSVDDRPIGKREPATDSDTGRQKDIWRVTGQRLDERWQATEKWQESHRRRTP